MKFIKYNSKKNFKTSKPFDFNSISELNEYNLSTSYIKGKSPEYQNEIDKLFMVVEGDVQLKIQEKRSKISPGDIVLVPGGEKFQFNAAHGAKLLRLMPTKKPLLKGPESELDFDEKIQGNIKELTSKRHSTREFLDKPLSKKVLYNILKIGMHAPSGANRQPWKFIVVGDPEIKRKIREGAERVERAYYRNLNNGNLIKELQNLGLTWRKPFLENAPFLICIFGDHKQPYYKESLWLATGWMLLAAAELGLGTLTYKPDDMLFLHKILGVSGDYTPELIMPIGYTAKSDPWS
jgi:nitroreductase/mannose-6-phosphate isomerase-like protein (cupin superfamily)